MALDKVMIGARIRKIREEIFEESRDKFGKRCDLTERHIGQIERGDFLISLSSLDMIASATGIDTDYILYGKGENNKLQISENLHSFIDRSDKEELKMYYKCICTIKSYMSKKVKDSNWLLLSFVLYYNKNINIKGAKKMNFKKDFSIEKQNLLQQADVKVEDKNYTSDEIRNALNSVCSYIMSQSTKNGDLSKLMIKYNSIIDDLSKNEY